MENKYRFHRGNPLFERKRVPCELLTRCSEGNIVQTNGNTTTLNRKQLAPIKKNICLALRVLEGIRPTSGTCNGTVEKALRLELSDEYADTAETNDSHPIQLYELEVGESDFADLRQDQALLVDFSNFATSFISLLLLCDLDMDSRCFKGSESATTSEVIGVVPSTANPLIGCRVSASGGVLGYENASVPSSSRYNCRLEEIASVGPGGNGISNIVHGSWSNGPSVTTAHAKVVRFSIVETNRFRELTHFSLNLRQATDSSARFYLSIRLREMMNTETALRLNLEQEVERRDLCERECSDKVQIFENYRYQSESMQTSIIREAEENLSQEKERQSHAIECLQQENNRKLQEIRDVAALEKSRFDSTLIELERKYEKLVLESSDKSYQFETDLEKAQLLVTSLEQAHKQQESVTSALKAELSQVLEEETRLRSDLNDCKVQLKEATVRAKSLDEEKCHFSVLVKKYQADRLEMKHRMKAKADMIQTQEEALTSRDIELNDLITKIDQQEMCMKRLQEELNAKEEEAEKLRGILSENKRTIDSNQQVISWLNKQINGSYKCGVEKYDYIRPADLLTMQSSYVDANSSTSCLGRVSAYAPTPSAFTIGPYQAISSRNDVMQSPQRLCRGLDTCMPRNSSSTLDIPEPHPYVPRDKMFTNTVTN